MSPTPNVFGDEWDALDDWSGGGAKSKRLVERGPVLGATVYELGPGNFGMTETINTVHRLENEANYVDGEEPRSA